MKNTIKISEASSSSWLILIEALFFGFIFGVFLFEKGVHPAGAITLALLLAGLIRGLIVYVALIFWVWTLGLGVGVAFLVFCFIKDTGWGIFWAAIAFFFITGIHIESREHNQMEDTPNEIKIIH